MLLSLIVVALAIILIYRIYSRIDKKTIDAENLTPMKAFKPTESPLYEVEQRLLEIGVTRYNNESFLCWVKRINEIGDINFSTIEKLFQLHTKLRFDPIGLDDFEQSNLEEMARHWLATHSTSKEIKER